jgi:probable phosphoglycerate mutase
VERFPWIADGVGLGERLAGVPGAESDSDVRARILPAVRDCLAALEPGQTGVAVTHGAALKIALGGLLGWQPDAVRGLMVLDNCHWATVVAAGQDGTCRLRAYGVGEFASLPAGR